jgi:hypothetical protein
MQDQAPVFKFSMPIDAFKDVVLRGHLILGTELTKHAHDSFAANHTFTDQLTGYDYLGEGKYGLEFEIRGDGAGRMNFPHYFAGAATTDDLANGRIKDIHTTTSRLVLQRPADEAKLRAIETSRMKRVESERKILKLVHDGADPKLIAAAVALLDPTAPAEIANIDGVNLAHFATTYASTCISGKVSAALGVPAPLK